MSIAEISNPFERFLAFIHERESIRRKRLAGEPYPWTDEGILQTYRFTNVNRENDKVSKHYQKTVRERYQNDAVVIPATVLYRWFNRIETCDAFFNEPDLFNANQTPFERYIESRDIQLLQYIIRTLPTPHVTGAFVVTGKPGYTKGEGVLRYFETWIDLHDWEEMWKDWHKGSFYLSSIYVDLQSDGLGSFMTAQLVADLKYLEVLRNAPDWDTWAASGPGSRRGLNALRGRDMDAPWNEQEWHRQLLILREEVNSQLIGIEPLHAQDLQNCLCEFSKYEKTRRGLGRPRQIFRNAF